MDKDQTETSTILARVLFLSAIKDFMTQAEQFREKMESIWGNHRKELLLKPDFEKAVKYALTAEYIPKPMKDYYNENHCYLETDARLLQSVLDRYSLGKIIDYNTGRDEKFAKKENITSIYAVKTSKGEYMVLETHDNMIDTDIAKLTKKLSSDSSKVIGTEHRYGKYFYIYQVYECLGEHHPRNEGAQRAIIAI